MQANTRPLKIVSPWEITNLQPVRSGFVFQRLGIVETLLSCRSDGTAEPGLTSAWGVTANGLRWRFEIRKNVLFHDLSKLTASAVVTSLEQARVAPAVLSLAPIASIEVEAENFVVIQLKQAFNILPALLAHYSTAILAPQCWEPSGGVAQLIGTGPYKVKRITPPQSLDTSGFEKYWGAPTTPAATKANTVTAVQYLSAGRAETRFALAQSEQADLVYGLDPASLERLRTSKRTSIQSVTVPRTIILKLNTNLASLLNVKARRALSLAIDRTGIAKALLRDAELAPTQLFPPALGRWHDPSLTPLAHDPKQASLLLAELGWKKSGEYLVNANNETFTLSLNTFPDRPELPIIATALQAQFKLIGIRLDVKIGNSGDIPLMHKNGTLQTGLASRNYGFVADPLGTLMQDFSPQGGDWGAMGWRDTRFTQLLETLAREERPRSKQHELIREANKILNDQLPVIPIAWYRQHVAISRYVRGVVLDPLDRDYFIQNMAIQN